MDLADVLQGGCAVETLEPPEHSVRIGCYYYAFPVDFGLDVWW